MVLGVGIFQIAPIFDVDSYYWCPCCVRGSLYGQHSVGIYYFRLQSRMINQARKIVKGILEDNERPGLYVFVFTPYTFCTISCGHLASEL